MRAAAVIGAMMLGGPMIALAPADARAQAAVQAQRPAAVALSDAGQAQSAARTPPPRRGLRWFDAGRWGLDFNLRRPRTERSPSADPSADEVEAGAYYRLSPRLRVGASAGLSEGDVDPSRPVPSDRRGQSRVRLESIFRF